VLQFAFQLSENIKDTKIENPEQFSPSFHIQLLRDRKGIFFVSNNQL